MISELEHFNFNIFEFFAFCLANSESGNLMQTISSKQSRSSLDKDDCIVFNIPLGALIIRSPPFFLVS